MQENGKCDKKLLDQGHFHFFKKERKRFTFTFSLLFQTGFFFHLEAPSSQGEGKMFESQ